jgi:hypothetical protein
MSARLRRCKTLARRGGLYAVVGLLLTCALAVTAAVVMHLADPAHFGLWWGSHAFFFGTADSALHVHRAREDTFWVTALVIVALCLLVARELVGFARASQSR